ncbi:MAG: class II glutamine amidotransferase [Deltaproteobacteria bacterium]|nr:class II glutamine amidotransferase [Deltaproteobacteria bacterium]
MNHLIAYIGNEPELLSCALFQARPALYWKDPSHPDGWGMGFVQGEEVLLQKRPRPEVAEVDFYALTKDLRADALVGRVGLDDGGSVAAENSDPFRFRSWLFGAIGHIEGFEAVRERLLQSVPEFLRRNIRGRSADEHLFHLFLAFLHDAGLLDVRAPEGVPVQFALHQSVGFLDKLLAADLAKLALVVTNGRSLVAETRGVQMQYLEVAGIADCSNPACPKRRGYGDKAHRVAHPEVRAVVIEADEKLTPRSGWAVVPDGHSLIVGLDRVVSVKAN